MESNKSYLTLKWGTRKSWDFSNSNKGKELMKEYDEIEEHVKADADLLNNDTQRQKEILCELIDLCDDDTIYIHYYGRYVSKDEAKEYILNYGIEKQADNLKPNHMETKKTTNFEKGCYVFCILAGAYIIGRTIASVFFGV